jgi:uncharacterized protein
VSLPFITAFVLGLTSSLHCVGMCGPIALAMPGRGRSLAQVLPGRLSYHLGRLTTYATLGALVGLFGEGFSLAGYQQGLSIALGVLLLLLALGTASVESQFLSIPAVSRLMGRLKRGMGRLLQRDSAPSLFNLGILNGLLPCGFVYLGLAGALATGEFWQGTAYMALFGLGTWPAMLTLSLIGPFVSDRLRRAARPVMLGVTLAFATLLILRGLDLGIPYLSPSLAQEAGRTIVECQ